MRPRLLPCAAISRNFWPMTGWSSFPSSPGGLFCTASSCAYARKSSAAKYATVWNQGGATGSPLLYFTQRQATLLQGWMGEAGSNVLVSYAMRYGNPSMASQLDALKAQGATRILIVPLYPQYSGTTTASVCDAVYDWAKTQRHIPELRFVQRYHDHPGLYRGPGADVVKTLAGKRPCTKAVPELSWCTRAHLHAGRPLPR